MGFSPWLLEAANLHYCCLRKFILNIMNRTIPLLTTLLTLAISTASSVQGAEASSGPAYHFVKEIPIGGDGGWDYLTVDESARRLYVTHNTKVVVIDLTIDKVVGEITDTPGVHGLAIVPLSPDSHLGFSSNGREDKISMIDLKTLKTTKKEAAGKNPDAILFVPQRAEIYAFNGRGQSVSVFEADDADAEATIELPGKPEFATTDPKANRVYVNLEDKNEVAVIDTATRKVVERWPIAPGAEASGMAIDLEHHRLFLGCANKLMVMMDSSNGKVVATVPIGGRVDANAFDPGTQLAFSSNGEGNVTIAHEDGPDKLTVVQTLTTEQGARTMALDPKTHNIYLASAKFDSAPEPGKRPQMVPGSFKVLVYAMGKAALTQ
jgi:DNA-binding beta-propeller fold protein YncE